MCLFSAQNLVFLDPPSKKIHKPNWRKYVYCISLWINRAFWQNSRTNRKEFRRKIQENCIWSRLPDLDFSFYQILGKGFSFFERSNKFEMILLSRRFFQKRTNKFDFTTCQLVSFVLWKKVTTPKRHFEINWPLVYSIGLGLIEHRSY